MDQPLYNKADINVLKKKLAQESVARTTISFYQYAAIKHPSLFRDALYILLDELSVLGRIYVSCEGVNAQVSVPSDKIEDFRSALYTVDFLDGVRLNTAVEDDGKSFFKLKIKVREKIVADGLDDSTFDVTDKGTHVDAAAFNKLADDPDTIIVDMRNHYESEVGHFQGAIRPDVETFREELPLVEQMLADKKDKKLLLYCTGGIRCEKASAYYRHRGFQQVYQLEGGIIKYAHDVQEQGLENKFVGKNFVFDERMGERISGEIISSCHQCGELCDTHVNCANDGCHILFIQCAKCAAKYDDTCSARCRDFNKLPSEQRDLLKAQMDFNGTVLGKGRYKAHHKDKELQLD